ncbi:MAG TPA: porphobilinogen synthase, partial [Thermoanaerobaculia bacterium]|nr:porphobilinogen synthase [Thermoanaerobaculia bacterium]
MAFPETRLRRLRRTPTLRRMVRETRLAPEDLVLPLFVRPGSGIAQPVGSMPGVFQHSVDRMVEAAGEAWEAGVPAVLLFGLPEGKDAIGSAAWDDAGVVQRGVRALAEALPELVTIADLCFCEYTDHGHCGVLRGDTVDNDATLENLGRQAVSLARSGVGVIAPSDMMDGRVGAVRSALDAEGFEEVAIL